MNTPAFRQAPQFGEALAIGDKKAAALSWMTASVG